MKKNVFDGLIKKILKYDPQSGEIRVLEHLVTIDNTLFDRSTYFLERYGINKSLERIAARKTMYYDALNLLQTDDGLGDIKNRPYRAIVKTAIYVFNHYHFH